MAGANSSTSGASARFSLVGTMSETSGAATRSISCPTSASYAKSLTNGTSNGMANCLGSWAGTVTSGTPVTLNLFSSVGASIDDPLVLLNVRQLLIQNQGTVTGRILSVGDATGTVTSAWAAPWLTADGGVNVDMGGALALSAPDAGYVVDTSHKYLILTSSSGAIPYQVDIIGVD